MEGFAFEVPKLKGFAAWVESYTAHLPSMDWWPTWLNPFNPEHFELTMFLAASTWLLLRHVPPPIRAALSSTYPPARLPCWWDASSSPVRLSTAVHAAW